MRLPYFFWNLKYNTVSFPLEEAAEELQHELTCLTAVKNNIMEIVKSYSLTKEHAVKYKNDSDTIHLENAEDNNKMIHYNVNNLRREIDLLNKYNSTTEEEFLSGEAEKKVINSPFFIALKNFFILKGQKIISSEELEKYIDETIELIYDFQENTLNELAAEVENSSRDGNLLVEKGLYEIDEGLAVIEHAFKENRFSLAEEGLFKIMYGSMKIQTAEIIKEGVMS
ncbi:MAG: hypothetical protein ABRQ39_28565 [Candidatus Eremiobacterota bacterium]